MSRLGAAVIGLIAVGVLRLESGHHVAIEAPAPTEPTVSAIVPACPDNDNQPYSATCLAYLKGATELGMRWRIKAEAQPTVWRADAPPSSDLAPTAASVCPKNDTMPYNVRCLAYLTGSGEVPRTH